MAHGDKARSDGGPVMQQSDLCECRAALINGGLRVSISIVNC